MPPGAEKLDFRGVWAWDADTAIVMSSGPGDASRLYKTTDGCSTWKLLYTNPDKEGFWDAVVAPNPELIYVLGDPVHGTFTVGRMGRDPNGVSVASPIAAPARAAEGAGAFAASNSSLVILGHTDMPEHAWFGTGGKPGAFVYRLEVHSLNESGDVRESQWHAFPVPLAGGADAAGVFSIGFRDVLHGVAVGGDYTKPNESAGTAAWSADGGKRWTAAANPPHGYRSAVAWDPEAKAWIAAGTNGSDISYDDGKTWEPLDDGNWNALSLPWIVGPQGRIAKVGKLPPRK
jgi:photosystem II stability/assembly factor-like uncharacterized protein